MKIFTLINNTSYATSFNRGLRYSYKSFSIFTVKKLPNDNINTNNDLKATVKTTFSDNKVKPLLNMFSAMSSNTPMRKPLLISTLKEKDKNYAYKPKHYPPANKEWFNSIYAYNNSTAKVLPNTDKVILRLLKSYFNFYSEKLEKKVKLPLIRPRARKLSTDRILVSRAEVKHTSDKAIITVYVYNRQRKYYLNKIKNISPLDHIDRYLSTEVMEHIIFNKLPKPSANIIRNIRNKALKIKSKLTSHNSRFTKSINSNDNFYKNSLKNYEILYLKHYAYKCLRKEIYSIYYKQLISFNKSKFENKYVIPFTKLARGVYNKKVEFNFVNLKYLYLNSYIFTDTLVSKLRNRENKLLKVLKTSLLMFTLPRIDGLTIYNDIYNREKKIQNLTVSDLTTDRFNLKADASALNRDHLDCLISGLNSRNSIPIAANNGMKSYTLILNNVFAYLKNKFVSGVRLEAAGRLTRRNTAARAISKLRYKGNIKNMDSSNKGLPTVMLRGHAKSNLQYSRLKSRIRIGSFGLKGWVSSS